MGGIEEENHKKKYTKTRSGIYLIQFYSYKMREKYKMEDSE